MTFKTILRSLWTSSFHRATVKTSDLLLAFTFALLFVWPSTDMMPTINAVDSYKVYILTSAWASDEDREKLYNIRNTKDPISTIGDVTIHLRVEVAEDSFASERMAQDLVHRPDTLLVIGHLPSNSIESVAPIYFGARPQVPFVATIATDDDLLVRCGYFCSEGGYVPLLQMAPANVDQAQWAVHYAMKHAARRFLVVAGSDPTLSTYTKDLVQGYSEAVNANARAGIVIVGVTTAERVSEKVIALRPDCVLYAGSAGEAESVYHEVTARVPGERVLLILPDSVLGSMPSKPFIKELTSTRSRVDVRFMSLVSARDLNMHVNSGLVDAVTIVQLLVNDLNSSGGDFQSRVDSFLGIMSANDARRNLVHVMEQNELRRASYPVESGQVYIFQRNHRFGGHYHVVKFEYDTFISDDN
jgi:hypothetical protein